MAGSGGTAGAAETAGSGGTAGLVAGGSGGSGTSAGAEGSGELELELDFIDRVEGEFPHILESRSRNGFWFLSDDGSAGMLSPLEAYALQPPRGDSYYSARISGSGFTAWGATIGITLKAPLAAYDASAYCGVSFFARGHGDGWALMIPDRLSEPEGGICSVDSSEPYAQCFDHFGKRFQPTDDWQEHRFSFDELELVKGYTGQDRAFESDAVFSLQFVFDNASGADFELLLDDVAFMVCK